MSAVGMHVRLFKHICWQGGMHVKSFACMHVSIFDINFFYACSYNHRIFDITMQASKNISMKTY
jgi:hypothetical protein